MARKNPFPGVSRMCDRHGKVRWRFRQKGFSCYLPGAYNSAEFRAAYEVALSGGKRSQKSGVQRGTVSWLIEQYLSSPKYLDRAESSKRTLRRELDWLRDHAGDLPFIRIEPHHVEALMRRKAGPAAANKVKKNLSMLFNYAARKLTYKGVNPARFADSRKENPDGFHTWSEHEIDCFMKVHGPGTMARKALMIFLCTGASRQEAARMGRQHIKDGRIVFRRGKTGVEADLPILEELATELALVPAEYMLFLTHTDGRAYQPETLGNWFRARCDEADLKQCSAHGLRKSGATRLAERGATEFEVMAFLAHATPKEAGRYVKAARRGRLADSGMARLGAKQNTNVSNLSLGLDKSSYKSLKGNG